MIRTTLFLTLALFATLSSNGQDGQSLEKGTIKVSAFFMPSIVANNATSSEVAFSPVTGLKVEKELSNRLALGTGLTYYTTDMYNGSWFGASCGSPNSTCHWNSKRTYLEVPLTATVYYSKTKGKINPYVTLGVLTAFSIKTYSTRIDEIGNDQTASNFETNGLRYEQNYLSAAFGTEFQLSDHLDLFVEPTFRYSINTMVGSIDFNHTMMVGLTSGLTLRI